MEGLCRRSREGTLIRSTFFNSFGAWNQVSDLCEPTLESLKLLDSRGALINFC